MAASPDVVPLTRCRPGFLLLAGNIRILPTGSFSKHLRDRSHTGVRKRPTEGPRDGAANARHPSEQDAQPERLRHRTDLVDDRLGHPAGTVGDDVADVP